MIQGASEASTVCDVSIGNRRKLSAEHSWRKYIMQYVKLTHLSDDDYECNLEAVNLNDNLILAKVT